MKNNKGKNLSLNIYHKKKKSKKKPKILLAIVKSLNV